MYDLICGHFALGYLPDDDLLVFLKRVRICLLKGRTNKPGIMVVMEPVTVKGVENYEAGD